MGEGGGQNGGRGKLAEQGVVVFEGGCVGKSCSEKPADAKGTPLKVDQ